MIKLGIWVREIPITGDQVAKDRLEQRAFSNKIQFPYLEEDSDYAEALRRPCIP